MPSSWDVYYVVFLSALLALGIPALLAVFSRAFSPAAPVRRAEDLPAPTPGLSVSSPRTALGNRINARFFLGVNASLVLISLGLALIPCAGMLRADGGQAAYLRGLIAVVSLAGLAGLGLLYASRKGDLNWVSTYQPDQQSSADRADPTGPSAPAPKLSGKVARS